MKSTISGILLIFSLLGAAFAQQLYIGPSSPTEPRWAKESDFDGSILFCRGHYSSSRHEQNGSGWWTDYPGADNNFMTRLAELTDVRVRFDEKRIPFYVVIPLNDPILSKCPILFMSDVGTIGFREDEIRNLRRYFDKGGFLWVDDFWGSPAWDQWVYEIRRVLPSGEYRMIDIPRSHLIMHQLYDVKEIPQMSTVGLWDGDPTVGTSERGEDSAEVHFRGLLDQRDRLVVVMTHNTDITDGWEDRMDAPADWSFAYSQAFSAKSYAIGVNIFLYALTH